MLLEGHAGNGLHFHFAPVRGGRPLAVRDPAGQLSESARWLVGGLVQLGGVLMAFGNRVDGSVARLRQAKEAPNTFVWGEWDRKALIRLPVVATDQRGREVTPPTVEFRLADGSALPHLLLASAALAMIQGRDTQDLADLLARTRSTDGAAVDGTGSPVPRDFSEVAAALKRHRETLERARVFPQNLVDSVIARLMAREELY